MNNFCSPSTVYDKTCFNLDALKKIANKLNKHPEFSHTPKIDISLYNKTNKYDLIDEIQKKLNCKKSVDFCVLNKKTPFYEEIKSFFKPKSPGSKKWLSTLDIKSVMEQYMLAYPNFIFYGPLPLDFADIKSDLRYINLKKLSKNKKKIGFIFNLDYSYESGSHWVSLFIDLENKTVCFFDSYGDPPPKEIKTFINNIITSGRSNKLNIKKIINTNVHQKQNNHCGIYSIYFLVSRLKGKSCDMVFDKIIRDEEMGKYRKFFFR